MDGKDKMSPLHSDNSILNKIRTLAVVNILEPVTKTRLAKSLSNTIDPNNISSILTELLEDGLISNEKRYYRVTYRGISFNISRQSKILRDIYRMKYLLSTNKQRGGDSVGQ